MLGGILTICGGTLASSSLLIARRPNAKDLIDKLTPYEGWIGLVLFCWGVWEVFRAVTTLALLSSHPLIWTFWLATGVADLLVGFILGFKLISKFLLSRNEAAAARGQELRVKLTRFQVPLGLFAIVVGVLYLIW